MKEFSINVLISSIKVVSFGHFQMIVTAFHIMTRVNIIALLSVLTIVKGGVIKDDSHTRIINGKDVEYGEIPYQVSLQRTVDSHHFCGGSILNSNHVITAAHCLVGTHPKTIKVIAGTIHKSQPQAVHKVLNIRVHKDYDPSKSWINDIALIEIEGTFKFSNTTSPITLPKPGAQNKADEVAVVSGWGRIIEGGAVPNTLQKVEVLIADQEYCHKVYGFSNLRIHDTQICAHDPVVEHGSCQGDSGGPLTVDGILVGLVSWAQGCAQLEWPTVYTRVSSYTDWIQKYSE